MIHLNALMFTRLKIGSKGEPPVAAGPFAAISEVPLGGKWGMKWMAGISTGSPTHHDTCTRCLRANDTGEEVLEADKQGAAEY